MAEQTKKFLIIDSNAIIHRAYHALPPLKTRKGELVNAVYGFALIFLKALKEIKPDYLVATFDLAEPTFRHKEFKEYKAKRKKAPDELYQQIIGVKKILNAFKIPIFEQAGFEADDLIGTIVCQSIKKQVLPKVENIILTGDLDALQLVSEQTKVYTMRKGLKDTVLYGPEEVEKKYDGLKPEQLTDFRALRGDPSDNIPGVTGIGQKTAIDLLSQFETLENLYQKIEKQDKLIEKIKPSVLKKLKDYKDQAFLSQKLARIDCQSPIEIKLSESVFGDYNQEKLEALLKDFGFFSLIKQLPNAKVDTPLDNGSKNSQTTLFTQNQNSKEDILEEIEQLQKQGALSSQLVQLEKDLIPIIKQMEKKGIKVEIKILNQLSVKLTKKLKVLEKEIFEISQQEFNLNSSQQLKEVLFDKLKISTKGIKKTPGGAISTNASQLVKLKSKHPIVGLIIDYRELFKLKSGFVDALPKEISPKDGRIHPDFHQLGTETGRMSCSSPNLQNIPVKGELAQEIRKAFVAEKGFTFLSADYSQMELRVVASLAQDKKMLEFFNQGKDIHLMTAAELFEVDEKEVSKKQRQFAKTMNFGMLYGMGPRKFSEQTGLDFSKAKEFIDKYFQEFEGIKKYVEQTIEQAREKGFSQTLFGRKRFIPEINSRDPRLRAQAERIARNLPGQGSAADIIKIAMNELAKQNILTNECRLLLQIHDELLFEITDNQVKEKGQQIKDIMEQSAKLKTPLKVDLKTGPNWGSLT